MEKNTDDIEKKSAGDRGGRSWRSNRSTKSVATLDIPDYSRLRRYAEGGEELARLGLSSIEELVEIVNARRLARKSWPLTQSDFPSKKSSFRKLVAEFERTSEEDGAERLAG